LGDKFVPAPVPGQMNAPEGVAFHDGWSDWEADKSPACAEYRETLKNSPPYYRGPAPRMKVYEEMLESGKVGCFAIIETAQNNIWRMLHVTPDSYRKNEVAEVLIKTRDNTFFAQGDGRNDGDTPKFYKSLQVSGAKRGAKCRAKRRAKRSEARGGGLSDWRLGTLSDF